MFPGGVCMPLGHRCEASSLSMIKSSKKNLDAVACVSASHDCIPQTTVRDRCKTFLWVQVQFNFRFLGTLGNGHTPARRSYWFERALQDCQGGRLIHPAGYSAYTDSVHFQTCPTLVTWFFSAYCSPLYRQMINLVIIIEVFDQLSLWFVPFGRRGTHLVPSCRETIGYNNLLWTEWSQSRSYSSCLRSQR